MNAVLLGESTGEPLGIVRGQAAAPPEASLLTPGDGLDAPAVAAAVETGRIAPVVAASVGSGAPAALDQLREIARATGPRRVQLREKFIAAHGRLFRLLAHRLCRSFGLRPELHREDVEQVIAMGAVEWVDELVADPAAIEAIVNFEGLLHVRSRASVRTWADRELSPASGMVSLRRRVRKLNQLRDELRAATGAEPTDEDVAREHNRRMTAARADAARQGMLATAGDLAVAGPAVDLHSLDQTQAMVTPEDGLLHAAEGPGLVRAIIDRARRIGGVTADVAEAWLSGVYASEGAQRVLTALEVADALGIPRDSAAAQIRKVRTLARRVLAEELGIDHA
ncbi:MAG: hypothetical protein QJR09_04290 [Micrococcus sp.]|nr:hypothetical protein [Micrococcus sp.]